MHGSLKRLLGEGPYPFPIGSEEFKECLDIYCRGGFSILVTKKPIKKQVETEVHAHNSYEFTIPLSHNPKLVVEKRVLQVKTNQLLSCNPEQFHGPGEEMQDTYLMAIQVEKCMLQEMSRSFFGKSVVCFENEPFDISSNLRNQIEIYMEEYRNKQAGYEFILGSLEMQIVLMLLREIKNNANEEKHYQNVGKANISRAVEFMRDNWDKKYSFKEVARAASISPYHFIKVFKEVTGKRPYEFFTDIKINKAVELLRNTSYSVTEVCFLCGFSNHSHFTKVFKARTGLTPSGYRKQMKY